MRMVWVFCWLRVMLVRGQDVYYFHRNASSGSKNETRSLNCAFKLTSEMVQMVIEYSKGRNLAHVIIVDENIHSGCFMWALKSHYRCFYVNRLLVSFRRKMPVFSDYSFLARQAIVVVTFERPDFNQTIYLQQANEIASSLDYFKWFSVVMAGTDANAVFETLALSSLSVDADVVVALKMGGSSLDQVEVATCNVHTPDSKQNSHRDTPTLLPFTHRNPNITNDFVDEYCGRTVSSDVFYCFVQTYKIRKLYNDSLLLRFLGLWDRETGTDALKAFQMIEKRDNFYKFPLILGKKTFTQETTVADENLIEDDNDEENMDKFSDFMTTYLNAREKTMVYPTLGLKAPDGKWNGLLGGVVEQKVDLGLDMVIKVPERYNDMSFSFDIMQSIRNIYVKPEESHSARDIFLIPFGTKMLLLVLMTGIICFVAMSLNLLLIGDGSESRSCLSAFSESSFWVLGVFCMQGSTIAARSVSGKMIIVMALLFTLLIYNSYSAFITSILSVKLKQIRTVSDLLNSNYVIAYSRNSQDEIYLRSMNNVSELNQIYLRGYLHSDITNITAGLLRATQGNYGFFATGHVARKQFLSISNYRCKYDMMELPVKQTRNNVAFPLSLHSPYKKLVNMCLIKMLESGVHEYITTLVAPSLPICTQQKTFRSARINDLFTCFILLGAGILAASAIVTLEQAWKRRGRALKRHRGPFPFAH